MASTKVTLVWVIAAAASYRRASGRWTNQPCAIITPEMPKALTSWTHTAMMRAVARSRLVRPNPCGRLLPHEPEDDRQRRALGERPRLQAPAIDAPRADAEEYEGRGEESR